MKSLTFGQAEQLDLTPCPPFFIIEGPDACGKTALAKYIANKLKAVYLHSTGKGVLAIAQPDYMENMLDNVEQCLTLSCLPVVMDRAWPSEQCYAPVLRKRGNPIFLKNGICCANVEETPIHEHFAKCVKLGAIYVFCLSDNAIARHKANINKDHAYSTTQYLTIYNNYVSLFSSLLKDDVPALLYTIEENGSTLDAFLNTLIHLYETQKTKTRQVKQS